MSETRRLAAFVADTGRNEMDPPLCGSTAMSHNEFKKIREPIEPQEVSPMKQEMTVLGIDLAKHVLHAVGMENTGKIVFRKRLSRHDLMPCIARAWRTWGLRRGRHLLDLHVRIPLLEHSAQFSVEGLDPRLQQMRPTFRPLHLLLLAEPFTHHLIHC